MATQIKLASHLDIAHLFTQLGERIRHTWAKHHYSEDALVETALTELNQSNIHKLLHANDLIEYALNPNVCNAAHQIDSPFGDLQQIMYSHSKFYIECLYWCDGTTAIHDHGFSGAFYVMSGSSINVEYDFEPQERINHHFSFGKLSHPRISKLTAGMAKSIYSGQRFIHSVFHLDNPTVSIVVRTYQDDDALPQFDYRDNKIRLVEQLLPEFSKKITAFRFILQSNTEKFVRLFKKIYLESPFDERYWLIRAFYPNLIQLPYLWDFINAIDCSKNKMILETVALEAMLHKVIQLRNSISDKDTRYFLALLLNLPTWKELLSFITQYNMDAKFIDRSLEFLGISEMPLRNEPITTENALSQLIYRRMESHL